MLEISLDLTTRAHRTWQPNLAVLTNT